MTPTYYLLDEEHHLVPTTSEEWAKALEHGPVRVAEDRIGDIVVSTVFLGLDHRFGDGPPIVFETMTYKDGEWGDQWRYSSWDDAVTGHACAVRKVREQHERHNI